MSLLIKALEQAAKDRKAGRTDVQPAAASAGAPLEPTLEPLPPPRAPAKPPVGTPSPSASEPLALDTAATAAPRRAPSSLASLASADAQQQQRARAAAVMQAGSSRSAELLGLVRSNPVLLLGGLAVLFGIGFGIYVYLQIAHPGVFVRQVATRPQEKPPQPPASPSTPTPTPPGLSDAQGAGTTAAVAPYDPVLSAAPAGEIASRAGDSGRIGTTPPSPSAIPRSDSQPPVASSAILDRTPLAEPPRSAATERAPQIPQKRGSIRPPEARQEALAAAPAPAATPAAKAPVAAAAVPTEPARERINVSATAAQPRLNPSLSQAYAQLQSGDTEEARALYSKVVQDEPLNIDGLLGLAYIAAQENRSEDATRLYMKILQLNPRHSIAQAALIGLVGRADPAASESRLKQLIAREPSPFLHFILGNLYADQGLWSQAQQAYFQAHTLEPGNADYAYNLAVGLDHLRQRKLALDFYQRAEELAASHGRSNFNVAHARERIRLLSSQGQ